MNETNRAQYAEWAQSRHEETRIAYLMLCALSDRLTPDNSYAFIGPGDYTEVLGLFNALKTANDIKFPSKLPYRPQMSFIDRPDTMSPPPPGFAHDPILFVDYSQNTPEVLRFLEAQQTDTIIMRNVQILNIWESTQRAVVDIFTWARDNNKRMLLTQRRGEKLESVHQQLIALGAEYTENMFQEAKMYGPLYDDAHIWMI